MLYRSPTAHNLHARELDPGPAASVRAATAGLQSILPGPPDVLLSLSSFRL